VSEDFLLKEEKFKTLRNRLLKSASDFYGRLSMILDSETDVASRRALAQSDFELAELTRKVGAAEAALAAHRTYWRCERRRLPSQELTPRCRPMWAEPHGGRLPSESDRKARRGIDDLSSVGVAASAPRRLRPRRPGFAVGLPIADGLLLYATGRSVEALSILRQARLTGVLAATPRFSVDARRNLLITIKSLGFVLSQTGIWRRRNPSSARRLRSLRIRPTRATSSPSCASSSRIYSTLSNVLFQMGRLAEAEAKCRIGLAVLRKLTEENPAVTGYRAGLAINQNFLVDILDAMGSSRTRRPSAERSSRMAKAG